MLTRSLRAQSASDWIWIRCALWLLWPGLFTGCTNFYGKGIQYQIEHTYGVTDPQFMRSMGSLVEPGILASNKVTTLLNGDEIFPAMLEAVRTARKSICLETYIYWSGSVGREFADALAERARAGVKVHVIIDWIGSRRIDSELLDLMRESGVEVERYNPLVWYAPTRLNHRDHRKLLIVDGGVGFTGGAGLADIWQGNADAPEHWRDSMFKLEGPAVAQMQAAFMDNWIKTTARVLEGDDYFPDLGPGGNDHAQVFKSSPREGTEDVRMMYLLSIASARTNIRLSASYYVPDRLTSREFIEAVQRGVKVEIILPGSRTDSGIVKHASRGRWGPLLEAGVKIYEYQPTMYHCKMMIVDDLFVSVGSANFGNRSFRLNDEANMNVFSTAFAAQQALIFEADKARCREVTYREWKKRSLWKRFLEMITGPFRAQLG
ncbi:MAG TPA: phospholipase D-like domain-containing protein [Verrucomicrobiae bacterium]|nr:phospholipase D-like domain-containing protein [Verrucomicrobiae bacterium]